MPFPVDKKYILVAEEKLKVKFPSFFHKKMMWENGGAIEFDDRWLEVNLSIHGWWSIYPFFDASDKKRLKRTCNDIVRENETARMSSNFPPQAIAIAENGAGDYLVFIKNKQDCCLLDDQVFWWGHETGELILVANDFSELSLE